MLIFLAFCFHFVIVLLLYSNFHDLCAFVSFIHGQKCLLFICNGTFTLIINIWAIRK